jgi:hypothetical protein
MQFFNSALLAIGIVLEKKDEPLLLEQDRLFTPQNWEGYREFISATPADGQVVGQDDLSDHYSQKGIQRWLSTSRCGYEPFDLSRNK